MLLILSSILSWILIIYKFLLTKKARLESKHFHRNFQKHRTNPLGMPLEKDAPTPFQSLYLGMKKVTLDLLHKNQHFSGGSYLTSADADFINTTLVSGIGSEIRELEKNLYVLSTITGLAPLLGLLGTVWGITTTFSHMQGQAGLNHTLLSGLSLALITTVLGLVTAIPALVAYNYLKNTLLRFETEMEEFATDLVTSLELQYRKVE